ncbi:hypothetical protein M3J09_013755 [Ascochyta lentis]
MRIPNCIAVCSISHIRGLLTKPVINQPHLFPVVSVGHLR